MKTRSSLIDQLRIPTIDVRRHRPCLLRARRGSLVFSRRYICNGRAHLTTIPTLEFARLASRVGNDVIVHVAGDARTRVNPMSRRHTQLGLLGRCIKNIKVGPARYTTAQKDILIELLLWRRVRDGVLGSGGRLILSAPIGSSYHQETGGGAIAQAAYLLVHGIFCCICHL